MCIMDKAYIVFSTQVYCALEGVDQLVEVKEDSVCNYTLAVHTPLLCQHPMMVPLGKSARSKTLSCTPVVSQLDYEDYRLKQGQSPELDSCTCTHAHTRVSCCKVALAWYTTLTNGQIELQVECPSSEVHTPHCPLLFFS